MSRPYEADAADMCDVLSAVPGVEHVALEFDGSGNGVLRIRLATGADEGQVVGAAVTGLRSRFGLRVEAGRLRLTGPGGRPVLAVVHVALEVGHRPSTLSVVTDGPLCHGASSIPERPLVPDSPLGHDTPAASRPEESARVIIERVEVVTERVVLHATVRLRAGRTLHSGSASATATVSGTHRAVATATARAVESVVGARARLDVEAADLLQVGADRVAVVVLTLLSERGVDRLTGSALVRGDGSDALVRATLDALNRRAEAGTGRRAPR